MYKKNLLQLTKKRLRNYFFKKKRTRITYLKFANTRVSPAQFLGKGRISQLPGCTHSNFNSRYCSFLEQCIKLCAEAPHEIKTYLGGEIEHYVYLILFCFVLFCFIFFFFACLSVFEYIILVVLLD